MNNQATADTSVSFDQEFVNVGVSHWRILMGVPLAVGMLTYLFVLAMPGKYASEALLKIDRATARSMEAVMTSPSVVRTALEGTLDGATTDEKINFVSKNLMLSDIEPGGERTATRLFRLTISAPSAQMAQTINSRLIDAWLRSTLPGKDEKAALELELGRLEEAAKINSELIDQMRQEATTLVVANSIAGEIATPISALLSERDSQLAKAVDARHKLGGISRDVIKSAPYLPHMPMPNKALAYSILATALSIPAMFMFLILRRRYRSPSA